MRKALNPFRERLCEYIGRLELPTYGLANRRSVLLSYMSTI